MEKFHENRSNTHKTSRWTSLTSLISLGILSGIACGLFFGEYTAGLQLIGDAYIGLMQMTVLPYIIFSLVANIGRLSLTDARQLAGTGMVALLVLWAIGVLIFIIISYFSLPNLEQGAFFSKAQLEPHHTIDFLKLFVPSNLFWSLANNSVPAVVIFFLLFGVAIIGQDNRDSLLSQFDIITATLRRVNKLVVNSTPIGVFCITASAAGTLTLTEFGRLQAYLLTFSLGILVASLVTLPMFVAACTPFNYRQILSASRSALLTAFVTANVFIVIPLLIDEVNQLIEKHIGHHEKSELPNVLLPIAYQFPALGQIITLVFVPFAAWFYGNPLALQDYPFLVGAGIFVLFGKVIIAIPFLLASLQIPQDIFELFLTSSIFAGRISQAANGMHLMALTILTTAAMTGLLHIRWRWLFGTLLMTFLFLLLGIVGIRHLLNSTNLDDYRKEPVILSMQLLESDVPVQILETSVANPVPLKNGQSRLDRIKARGSVRVGFLPDHLPFSYHNSLGQLVGLDVDLMHQFAHDLGIEIEFVPYQEVTLAQQLTNDHFDIAISGVTATLDRSADMLFSEPYAEISMALVVPDHHKDRFDSVDNLRQLDSLTIGVEAASYFAEHIRQRLPYATVVELPSERQFFEKEAASLDVLATSAEGGSAWTLVYPDYVPVLPFQNGVQVPLVLALAGQDFPLEEYLKNWIRLKRLDGTLNRLFNHWIYGKPEHTTEPRWSIMRDVLHWVD